MSEESSKLISNVSDLDAGVLAGDRSALARAITLIESTAPQHKKPAQELLARLMPHSGESIRIGITGVPGAGKSTFIDTFGSYLTERGLKVAVLAIDPSSTLTRGSILGDKTRMEGYLAMKTPSSDPLPPAVFLAESPVEHGKPSCFAKRPATTSSWSKPWAPVRAKWRCAPWWIS